MGASEPEFASVGTKASGVSPRKNPLDLVSRLSHNLEYSVSGAIMKEVEVNVHQAKTHLSRLLQRVANGEEITIANRGVAVARLVPVVPRGKNRPLGLDDGKIRIADDFDAPLPDSVLHGFLGNSRRRKRSR